MAYSRADGTVDKHDLVADTTAISQGELVMQNGANNEVIAWTTGNRVLGIAVEASASGAVAKIEVDILKPGDALFVDPVDTAPARNDFDSCDGDKNSIDPATKTNFDFTYVDIGSDTRVKCWPQFYAIGGQATADPS